MCHGNGQTKFIPTYLPLDIVHNLLTLYIIIYYLVVHIGTITSSLLSNFMTLNSDEIQPPHTLLEDVIYSDKFRLSGTSCIKLLVPAARHIRP